MLLKDIRLIKAYVILKKSVIYCGLQQLSSVTRAVIRNGVIVFFIVE